MQIPVHQFAGGGRAARVATVSAFFNSDFFILLRFAKQTVATRAEVLINANRWVHKTQASLQERRWLPG